MDFRWLTARMLLRLMDTLLDQFCSFAMSVRTSRLAVTDRSQIAAIDASESFTVSIAATLPKKREVYGISHPLIAIIIGVEVVFRC